MCDADLGAEGRWRGEYVFGGGRVSCCEGNNIIRHLLFDHQEGKRAFLEEDADALSFEPGRETGSVK